MDLVDERLFRELMTQIKGTRAVQLITREGVIIHSLLTQDITGLDLSTLTNMFLSNCEHILVSLNLQDVKSAMIQADDGFFIVLRFEADTFLVLNIVTTTPMNVVLSSLLHFLEKQVPLWRHDDHPLIRPTVPIPDKSARETEQQLPDNNEDENLIHKRNKNKTLGRNDFSRSNHFFFNGRRNGK